jgi:hypothetical protein
MGSVRSRSSSAARAVGSPRFPAVAFLPATVHIKAQLQTPCGELAMLQALSRLRLQTYSEL